MITEQYIHKRICQLIQECHTKRSCYKWSIIVNMTNVEYTKPNWMGLAESNGRLSINGVFVGTEHYELLDTIILHELAHFAVGLEHQHDALWRYYAELFGIQKPEAKTRVPNDLMIQLYKYVVVVHTDSGEYIYALLRRKARQNVDLRSYTFYGEDVKKIESVAIDSERGILLANRFEVQ